jgi:hypothetical protein
LLKKPYSCFWDHLQPSDLQKDVNAGHFRALRRGEIKHCRSEGLTGVERGRSSPVVTFFAAVV